jgi:transglutaminase-like putative cysteine protease
MPYSGTGRTVEEMERLARGPRGELSVELRLALEDVIRYVRPRDQLSLLAALHNWFDRHYHFVKDPKGVEQVKDPVRLLEEIESLGRAVGDCDDASTFFGGSSRALGMEARLVRVGFRDPTPEQQMGSEGGRYSHVLAVVYDQYGRPIVVDPVAGRRTPKMLKRVRQYAKSPRG